MQFTGKTVEEAVETGLSELGVTIDKAKVTVITEPTKGLFGRIKGKAVVEVEIIDEEKVAVKEEKPAVKEEKPAKKADKLLQEDEERAVNFVQGILDIMEIKAVAKLSESGKDTVITLESTDSSSVIGYRGEVLDAIQTLAGAAANIGKKDYKKVVVDCENYRDRREETLIKLAKRLEEKATELRREVILEPMSPFERRIIHTTLSNSETVKTRSDGKEPNRYVVIVPNDKDEFYKPYNAGRNNGDRNRRDNRKGGRGGKNFKGGNRGGNKKGGSGFSEEKRKPSLSFGTYLGNSLKDKE